MNLPVLEAEAKRRQECPNRTPAASCADIDRKLGFRCGIPLDLCDECWVAGSQSLLATRVRDATASVVMADTLKQDFNFLPPRVLAAIAKRIPSRRAEALAQMQNPRHGQTKWLGIWWFGRDAKPRIWFRKWVLGKRPPSCLGGCGCMVWLKMLTIDLKWIFGGLR